MTVTEERAVGIYRLHHPILNYYLFLKAAQIKLPVPAGHVKQDKNL